MKKQVLPAVLLSVCFMACNAPLTPNIPTLPPAPRIEPTLPPPPAATPTVPQLGILPATPNNAIWRKVTASIEVIHLRAHSNSLNVDHPITVVRIDPTRADIKVQYTPTDPHRMSDWHNATDADVIINAGFFTPQKTATGLLIANGKVYGQSYKGFGGMFSIRDGKPRLQWLGSQPYTPDAKITQAVQTFPMLVQNSKVMQNLPAEDRHTYRSFIGIDKTGKILLGITRSSSWMLSDLAAMLASNPILNVDSALNLDGGASTGIWLRGVPEGDLSDSYDTVPSVITVKSK